MSRLEITRRTLLAAAPAPILASSCPAGAAGPSALRFLVVGDWGRDGAYWQTHVARAMRVAARDWNTAFVVSTGDNFYEWGVKTVRDPQWDSSFESIYAPELGPWYVVPGNHDYAGNIEAQIERSAVSDRWRMPHFWHDRVFRQPGLPAVHMFFIDTVAWKGRNALTWGMFADKPDEARQDAQRQWLADALKRSDAPVKIVIGHHGIYSVGKHGGRRRMADLDDMLHANNVTAYVHGHDHCMFHITQGPMHYLCSGAGSEMRSGYKGGPQPGCVTAPCPDPADQDAARWHTYLGKFPGTPFDLQGGFALFEVTATEVSVVFLDRFTRLRHRATLHRNPRQANGGSPAAQSAGNLLTL
jgi:tartrate-resistant acid phosphatase type 5